MDLSVPERIRPLRQTLLSFVETRVYPVESVLERGFQDPDALHELKRLQAEAKAEGLWALGHPKHLGGAGLPLEDYLYVNEVVGMSEYAMFVFGTHTLHDAMMLDKHGGDEWRARYLEPLVSGEILSPAFAMTERDVAGSDPTELRTEAVLDGDEWVINGTKWFTTHAHSARFTVVMARTVRGTPLADRQLIQKMVFDTAAEITSARLLTLDAARALQEGGSGRVEIGLAKVVGAAMLHNAIDRAIQVHGSIGVSDDLPLARMYRNARYARLYDGADEVHISNVARTLLRPFREALESAP